MKCGVLLRSASRLVGVAAGILSAVIFCGCAGEADDGDVAEPVSSSTVCEAPPTTLELAAGRYAGEYRFEETGRDEAFELTIEVTQDGELRVLAKTREGSTVQLTGLIDEAGMATAIGRTLEQGGEVTMTGGIVVKDGVVWIEGSWQTSSQERGTWTAEKLAK